MSFRSLSFLSAICRDCGMVVLRRTQEAQPLRRAVFRMSRYYVVTRQFCRCGLRKILLLTKESRTWLPQLIMQLQIHQLTRRLCRVALTKPSRQCTHSFLENMTISIPSHLRYANSREYVRQLIGKAGPARIGFQRALRHGEHVVVKYVALGHWYRTLTRS